MNESAMFIAPAGTDPREAKWATVGTLAGDLGVMYDGDGRISGLRAPWLRPARTQFEWTPTPGSRRTLGLLHGVYPPEWLDERDLTWLWPAPGALTPDGRARLTYAMANFLNVAAVGGVAVYTPRGGIIPGRDWYAVCGRLLVCGARHDTVTRALRAGLLTTVEPTR